MAGRAPVQEWYPHGFWGQVGAVGELVRRMSDQLSSTPQVFVAGGDASRLAAFLPQARVVSELVLAGIALCADGSPIGPHAEPAENG